MSQQEEAIEAIIQWWKEESEQEFYLSGYAGVGKTYVAGKLPEILGLPFGPGGVMYGAYTGKAASVLAAKGCRGARTLHSLIYIPRAKGREELRAAQAEYAGMIDVPEGEKIPQAAGQLALKIRKLEEDLAQPGFLLNEESDLQQGQLLIVDEVSMVSADMARDLRSFGCRMIVMGDPAQLPPVAGDSAFDHEPDYLMTEIRRQAAGSPVLRLATLARQGSRIPAGRDGDTMAYKPLQPWRMASFDQVLCGRNKTRHQVNQIIRKLRKATGDLPEPGDKIICLENNKDFGILNGHMFTVIECHHAGLQDDPTIALLVRDDEGNERTFNSWAEPFSDGEDGEQEIKRLDYHARQRRAFFTYGHAITVHKSQGSQWNNVLVIDESRCFRAESAKWLYTGITRAAEAVTIVHPGMLPR